MALRWIQKGALSGSDVPADGEATESEKCFADVVRLEPVRDRSDGIAVGVYQDVIFGTRFVRDPLG
jgi:hypothetical protein